MDELDESCSLPEERKSSAQARAWLVDHMPAEIERGDPERIQRWQADLRVVASSWSKESG